MRAIVFAELGGPEVLSVAEVPKPELRPGMVLVKNHAVGVNFADTRFRQGTYAVKPRLPDTPGLEAAGTIEAVGEGVTNLRPGVRVAAFASKTYAEYCLAQAFMIIPLPDDVSFVDGAAFPIQVLTAYHLLHTAGSTGPGKSVLVHSAAGGVGLAAVQLAKIAGDRKSTRLNSSHVRISYAVFCLKKKREPERRDTIRIKPQEHRVVAHFEHNHLTCARHSRQLVAHLQQAKVPAEDRLIPTVGGGA